MQTQSGNMSGDDPRNSAGYGRILLLKTITLVTIVTYLLSGLLINFLQLIIYLTIRRFNFQLYTKINYYLMYTTFSIIACLFDWFYQSEFVVYYAKKGQEDEMFKEHSIFLPNHSYNLDWSLAWLVTDKYGHLANCKAMLKADLKYIPVTGWAWAMSDQLFLDRNWEKDKYKLQGSLDTLLKYNPMVATFFCEGTRFSNSKHLECVKFAKERGFESPKYHLIPRTKGFVAVVKHLKKRQKEEPNLKIFVYNTQAAFDKDKAQSIGDIVMRGLRPKGHLYFEKLTLDDVPEGEEECAKWLRDLYVSKDKLEEYFRKNNSFPGHIDKKFVPYKPRLATLFNWIFWTCCTFGMFIYFIINNGFYFSLALSCFFMLAYLYLSYVMHQADEPPETKKVD